MSADLIYKEECYKIVGACMEVHKILGSGFLEAVYQEALAIEFTKRSIPYEQEKELEISCKDVILRKKYNADFVCYGKIIVETKALNGLISDHIAQTLNYLKATKYRLGILVNFGERSLKYERVVL